MFNKLLLFAITPLVLVVSAQASGTNLITNGDFETGTFSGWTAASTQATSYQAALNDGRNSQIISNSGGPAWYLRNVFANLNGTPATPISGYSAFNSFDGDPGVYTAPAIFYDCAGIITADFKFTFAVQASYGGTPRVLEANILDAAGTSVLSTIYSYTVPFTSTYTTWDPTTVDIDIASTLNALGAGTYQLQFRETIPQSYSGPAQFAIDNISLDVSPVPEPTTAIFGVSLLAVIGVGRRRSVLSVS